MTQKLCFCSKRVTNRIVFFLFDVFNHLFLQICVAAQEKASHRCRLRIVTTHKNSQAVMHSRTTGYSIISTSLATTISQKYVQKNVLSWRVSDAFRFAQVLVDVSSVGRVCGCTEPHTRPAHSARTCPLSNAAHFSIFVSVILKLLQQCINLFELLLNHNNWKNGHSLTFSC